MAEDIKTLAIVLRRTNYGEADRILNLITPEGKISAIVKGVRKARSKLAGGVEMFCLSELVIHLGRSEMGVVTSARMREHYSEIMKNYDRMTLAGMVLKQIAKVAEQVDSPEWFDITRQCLTEINNGTNVSLVEAWFWLNLLKVSGEEVNLYRDISGEPLQAEARYDWDVGESAFAVAPSGKYGADEIKILRLMTKVKLSVIRKIKTEVDLWGRVLDLARIMAKN